MVASTRDEPPRDGERSTGQNEPRQTEEHVRRHGAVPVAEQVLQRAARHEGCPAAEQDQNYGRDNPHCTRYTLNRLPVAASRQTNTRELDRPAARLAHLLRRANENLVDRHRLPYFTVADLATTLERVRELGGSIIHPGDRWAVCRDSEGSPFALAAAPAPGE